jgi:hypothetical protein
MSIRSCNLLAMQLAGADLAIDSLSEFSVPLLPECHYQHD